MRWQAIRATKEPIGEANVAKLLEDALGSTGFAGAMANRMSKYPQKREAIGARSSLGKGFGSAFRKRKVLGRGRGYRRTGRYGRDWGSHIRLIRGADSIAGETRNNVRYAVYVGGPAQGPAPGTRQAAVMAEIGWPNITRESQQEWNRWRPRIIRVLTQRDPRITRRRYGV